MMEKQMEKQIEKQNVTLAIPKEVLHKVKRIAHKRHTSLSSLLTKYMEEIVEHEEGYAAARREALALMEKGLPFNLGEEGVTWKREDLYDRVERLVVR